MKKRMILALVLVLAMLCMACAHDADEGTGAASGSESSLYEQSVSVAETSTESSAESTSSADGTSDETSTVESASSETSTESETSSTTTSADSTSSETSTGTESSATSSDASTPSKPAENSENSKPAEGSENSKPTEGSENGGSVDTSSGSGNPSQTAHKHEYVKSIGKSSTCTEDGYMVYTCSCGDSYKGEVLPATGHFLTESITKEPTGTERGTIRYRCSNRGCDYEETREIYSWNELARVVEERILYWVNKYRAEEGAPTLTMSKKLTEFDEYRCQQSLQGGEHEGHNLDDIAKAAEATKCGTFYDFVYHGSDGTDTPPGWESPGQEAWIGRSYWDETAIGDTNAESRIDDRAKNIVDAFRASAGHWVYVGGKGTHYKDYVYVGIGIGPKNCFITVCRYNPDEKGYEHITMDENGRMHSEWVKD